MSKPKIVFLDIETLMIPEETLSRIPSYGAYPGRGFNGTVSSILCFGYKIQGEKQVKCINAWDYPGFKKNPNNDKELCRAIHEILKDADAIVTQNGKRFDIPVINTRLAKYGLPPVPKSLAHIDTKNVFKANYAAYDNKLDSIAKTFGCETKLENGGWQLWMDMYKNKESSKKLMERYCKQDVNVLEQVFIKLLPCIKGLPNHNLFTDGTKRVCPNCGSHKLHINDTRRLSTGLYIRYKCQSCGSVSRDKKPTVKAKPSIVKD
jgi:DNA polymerase elongation subunit (family B)